MPRHEGVVVAEDQEPLARAFGQVRAPGESSRQASGWATVDQVNRRFAAACAAAGLNGHGDACRAAGLLRIAMAVNCTKLDLVEPESPTLPQAVKADLFVDAEVYRYRVELRRDSSLRSLRAFIRRPSQETS